MHSNMKVAFLRLDLLLYGAMCAYGLEVHPNDVGADAEADGPWVSWPSKTVPGKTDAWKCQKDNVAIILDSKTRAVCCPQGHSVSGPQDGPVVHCCPPGHELAGSQAVGLQCCPIGQTYDGQTCKENVCENGKVLGPDGECVCPEGQVESPDGTCKPRSNGKCESGLKTGKCYTFTGWTGRKLSYVGGQYSEAEPHKAVVPGKFQLCTDEKCTPGIAVNPNTEISMKDLHGAYPDGSTAGYWVNNAAEGAHISKTPNWEEAGKFSITKWPCGKYCVAGLESGLGQACPSNNPAITFRKNNPELCSEFDLVEVPCKIRDVANNCIWKNGKDQCCEKVDCSSKEETEDTPGAQ